MRSPWTLLLLVLGVCVGVAYWWGPPSLKSTTIPTRNSAMTLDAVPTGEVAQESSADTAASKRQTPVSTLALDAQRWQRALDGGDLEAGRAWYKALARCDLQLEVADRVRVSEGAPANSPLRVAPLVRDWLDSELAVYCGNRAITAKDRFALLLRLANAGDPQSQLRFALDPPLQQQRAVEEIDLIEEYRRHAPRFLVALFELGSVQALHALLDAHTPELRKTPERINVTLARQQSQMPGFNDPIAYLQQFQYYRLLAHAPHQQIIEPDAESAYRFALVCEVVCHGGWKARAQSAIARLTPTLTPKQIAAARRDADRARARGFNGKDPTTPVPIGLWWSRG